MKTFPLVVSVQTPFRLEVGALQGAPGKTSVDVQIENRSKAVQSGRLRMKLPAGWEALTQEIAVDNLQPGENRKQTMQLVWKPDWKENESASVVFQSAKGNTTQNAIIPNQYVIGKAEKPTLDGDLKEWPASLQLPGWMLGSTLGEAQAKLWVGWAPEGLYGAVEVHNSKAQVQDPRSFWGGDVLELFLSTRSGTREGGFVAGDHQFWLVPVFKEKRVYGGQWKVKEEIPTSRYDIPEVKGSSRLTSDGYVMEFFIPATTFQSYAVVAGGSIGLNANLTVRGPDFDREVFWPRKKGSDLSAQPELWGTLKVK